MWCEIKNRDSDSILFLARASRRMELLFNDIDKTMRESVKSIRAVLSMVSLGGLLDVVRKTPVVWS